MVEAKQVKVDNWGIFFLQRLQQFYNKAFFCDLTLQFDDNVQIKVHRLVMNACTEYFQMLENTCVIEKDIIMMPSNLPSDVVIPIINFMYSGILEFNDSLFDRLYATAKLMNMSVLTKLLDAQKNPIQPIKPVTKKVQSVTPITWNLQGKKIMTKNVIDSELPETLPGRKLPIWKRKSAPITHPYIPTGLGYEALNSKPFIKSNVDEAPKPTRFEWPDEDSTFENSFDEISYMSKPIILPSLTKECASKPSTSNSTFDEIKRSGPMKRSASPIGNQCKKVNIQDVKEYLKEHKIRSDYIDYDDSETTDNDLQTYDNADDHDSNDEGSKDGADIFTNQPLEDTPSKGILKTDKSESSPNKHVRFSLDGKDHTNKPTVKVQTSTSSATPDHTKIITEVLKKYPHLVKKNKNIRLKILAKGANPASTPVKISTAATTSSNKKIQYMVMKSETSKTSLPSSSDKKSNEQEQGPWVCKKCEQLVEFSSYHTYRQHLTEVHNEKTDSQMCNICGQICRKQNMLVYHKYTKHNIAPPAMYNFPKCKECSYIAISPTLLNKHVQQHCTRSNQHAVTENKLLPQWGCQYCDKAFFSENILLAHQKRSHNIEDDKKELVDSKEKIKILSDIKVNTDLPPGTTLIPVRQIGDIRKEDVPEPLEPSSEAEALSNVASGIAASLGLVDTIVVLDENQFILQSTQGVQQNVINNTGQDYILPDMQIPDLTSIATTSIDPNQTPVVTLSSDTNTVLTQSLNKSEIATTDELVMVLTDHDYSDAANQAVISGDNNIVVLYSHPVQTQAAMMINSETGMLEVDKNYQEATEISTEHQTEESIEMIQQEINNHLETDIVHQHQQQDQYNQENQIVEEQDNTYRVCSESVARILQDNRHLQHEQLQQAIIVSTEQPMVEESIQMIQDEINNIPQETETMDMVDTKQEMYQQMEIEDNNLQNQQEDMITNELHQEQDVIQDEIENQTDLNSEQNITEIENVEFTQEYEDKQNDLTETQEYISEKNDYMQEKEYILEMDSQDQNMEENNCVVPETEQETIMQETTEYEEQNIDTGEEIQIDTQNATENEADEENNPFDGNETTDSQVEEIESEDIKDAPEENIEVITESSKILDSTEELLENTQKMLETVDDIQENQGMIVEDNSVETEDTEINKLDPNQDVLEHEISENIHEVTEDAQEVSEDVHEVSEDIQEDSEPIHEISEGIHENSEIIHEVSEHIPEEPEHILEEIEHIPEETEIISEVSEQIHEVSEPLHEVSEPLHEVSEPLHEVSEPFHEVSESLHEVSEPVNEISEPMQIEEESIHDEILNESSEDLQNQNLTSIKTESETEQSIEPSQNTTDPNASEKMTEAEETNPKSPENDDDEEENIVEAIKSEVKKEIIKKAEKKKLTAISSVQAKEKISKLLDDWDDADTDSPQSKANNGSSINKLIDDWEDEEDT